MIRVVWWKLSPLRRIPNIKLCGTIERSASLLSRTILPVLGLSLCCGTATRDQSVPAGFSDALVMGGWNEALGFTTDANGRVYVWE